MAIKVRDYEVRLTRNKEERRQVRALRYDVFVEEEGASATEEQKNLREEYDSYDRFADYMAVFHNGKIVGTYRIIDRNAAEKMGGFYTETEFDISKIKNVRGNIAEMSRACIAKPYRENALVMRMLWAGLAEYVLRHKITLLFGVASWVGKNPADSAQAISYLYQNHLSPMRLRATVRTELQAESVNTKMSRMNILPTAFIDEDSARRQMTPLIKGYLSLGATFGRGVFIDAPFNSYDVFVLLQTKDIDAKYQKHFLGRENALDGLKVKTQNTLSKIMLMPFTASVKLVGAFFEFLLHEDVADMEYTGDEDDADTKGNE